MTAEVRYAPFGTDRYAAGTTPTSYRFTGQRKDATIGLYFYNSRYYDPLLGRFIQSDTLVPNPSVPQSLNRYAYTLNNPLRYIDPSGHLSEEEIKTLLGDNYDTLMELWKKYDAYFVDVLNSIESGGILKASLLGDVELHFEGSGSDIQATVYNGSFSNKLWDWQGKGVYNVQNPGMSEEQAARNRDTLFNQNANDGWMQQPVFDYGLDYGDIQYLGVRVLKQNINWQLSSATGEILGELPGVILPPLEALGLSVKLTPGVGLVVSLTDIISGSLYKSLTSPRAYTAVPYTTLNKNLMPTDKPFSPFVSLTDIR